MAKPLYRFLRGYTLDPGFSTLLDTIGINETTYRIRWEDLTLDQTDANGVTKKIPNPGPSGEYFEVIDIDPASKCYYEPVDLNDSEVLSQNGLPPSEGNPKFHQQFVYTIAMKTLEQFEQALGRRLIWEGRYTGGKKRRYVARLRLHPHALREANAYYSSEKKAVLFGYFKAATQVRGTNFPGGAVFTCLSPDIIAHEVTHAIVDSIHPRFMENTNRDVPAFHEGFADIIALLQRFTISELVVNQMANSGGSLDRFNLLGELATQFGSALAHSRGTLRSAIGSHNEEGKWERKVPNPVLYQCTSEPHERGSILVATFFDALIKVYNFKTADLIRIASDGTGILQKGAIPHDLAKRLANEVCEIAGHLQKIAIRALDYCPPVDITFGDFLRALITADMEFSNEEENNYRVALIDAFRSWGIFPKQVNTLSEESLKWSQPVLTSAENRELSGIASFLRNRVRDIVNLNDRKKIFHQSQSIQGDLHDLIMANSKNILGPEPWERWLNKLGLTSRGVTFRDANGAEINENNIDNIPVEVHKVKPAYRVGKQGLILEQVIVTITQSVTVKVDLGGPEPQEVKFRGGSTLIFDSSSNFKLSYIITKNLTSNDRFLEQLDYQQGGAADENSSFSGSMYDENNGFQHINFAHLHFH